MRSEEEQRILVEKLINELTPLERELADLARNMQKLQPGTAEYDGTYSRHERTKESIIALRGTLNSALNTLGAIRRAKARGRRGPSRRRRPK